MTATPNKMFSQVLSTVGLAMSTSEDTIADNDDDIKNNTNIDQNDAQNSNDNDNEEKKSDDNEKNSAADVQPLYKIVQHITLIGIKETDFHSLNSALSYWESLTILMASIWFEWDNEYKTWTIKDSYGTVKATQKIIDFMNDNYNSKYIDALPPKKLTKQSSLISYLTNIVNKDNDNNNTTKEQPIKAVTDLNVDCPECDELIVSAVYSLGFQCYFIDSLTVAQQTWKSLGLWYASVWFTRNAMGQFVVYDNFGTSDSVRKICRFVNEAQEKWNYTKTTYADKEEEDMCKLCVVCFSGKRDHILIPCGHICLCAKCKDLYTSKDATCPMCRNKVEKVIKTFN